MALAYRYHRFSSKAQDRGTSLERQREATGAMCEREGWTIAETLEDLGRSAWKGDHIRAGELGKFKARVDAGEIAPGSILVIENLDRLSRENVKVMRRFCAEVTEAGVNVAVANKGKVFSADSFNGENIVEFLEVAIDAKRAREESTRKSELVSAHWNSARERARQGKKITARGPAWLVLMPDRSAFNADPHRAAIVHQIYQAAADGLGFGAIAKRLNEAGEKPWGKSPKGSAKHVWEESYIRLILTSPAVEGEYHPTVQGKPSGERIIDYYPRVVPAELAARARAAIASRAGKPGPNHEEARNLFAGKVVCASCRGTMIRKTSTVGGKLYEYFRCQTNKRGGECDNRAMFKYVPFEAAALDQMLHLALDNSFFLQRDDTLPLVQALAEANKAVENKEAEQRRLLAFVMKYDDAEEAEAALAELRPTLRALKQERDDLQAALERARGAASPEEHLQRVVDVREALNSDDTETRQSARRRVREAMQNVLSSIEANPADQCEGEPQRTLTMILAGGYRAYKFSNEGELIASINLHNQPALQKGIVGTGADRVVRDIKRRASAA